MYITQRHIVAIRRKSERRSRIIRKGHASFCKFRKFKIQDGGQLYAYLQLFHWLLLIREDVHVIGRMQFFWKKYKYNICWP